MDVHLTAPGLTVSADTGDALLQRGDLPGRKVGRKWLTTTTAVLQWLEQSATPHPAAAQATALARGLNRGTGHLASMRPPENQRLDTGKG